MKGWYACCLAGVSVGSVFCGALPAFGQQRVQMAPGRTGKPVPRPSVEQARAEMMGLLPGLAEVPRACPRPEGKSNAMAIEVEGVELVRRMRAYPDLAPTAISTLEHWTRNLKKRVADCSGRGTKTGSARGGGLEPVIARRQAQISKASLAFARYRSALGN